MGIIVYFTTLVMLPLLIDNKNVNQSHTVINAFDIE